MEAEQYVTKQPMDHWRNQKENKKNNAWRQMKTQWSKTHGDTAEAIIRGFTLIQAYFKKQEKSQINNLALDVTELEK